MWVLKKSVKFPYWRFILLTMLVVAIAVCAIQTKLSHFPLYQRDYRYDILYLRLIWFMYIVARLFSTFLTTYLLTDATRNTPKISVEMTGPLISVKALRSDSEFVANQIWLSLHASIQRWLKGDSILIYIYICISNMWETQIYIIIFITNYKHIFYINFKCLYILICIYLSK